MKQVGIPPKEIKIFLVQIACEVKGILYIDQMLELIFVCVLQRDMFRA